MKHLLIFFLTLTLLTACKKSDCVQCARQVKAASQPGSTVTTYDIVYEQYCGRVADTAMSSDPGTYQYFVTEHGLVEFSCFYTN